jgi:hypothetical protein
MCSCWGEESSRHAPFTAGAFRSLQKLPLHGHVLFLVHHATDGDADIGTVPRKSTSPMLHRCMLLGWLQIISGSVHLKLDLQIHDGEALQAVAW